MASPLPIPGSLVLEILDGCGEAASREAAVLGGVRRISATELRVEPSEGASLQGVARLRTVVAASVSITAPGRRPRAVLETSVIRRFTSVVDDLARALGRSVRFSALRLEAAGADTDEMRRIATELAAAVGLPEDREDGDLVVRLRRDAQAPDGWELLVRTTPRPLATRAWRTTDYPGAVNATIAAAVLARLDIGAEDTVLDMMCGSGTFLVEQLFLAVPRRAVGADLSEAAIEAARGHQRAARRKGRIDWIVGDVLTTPIDPGFTRLVVNPPWGTLHGEHATNEALHAAVLARAAQLAAPGALLGVLTHEIARMHRVVDEQEEWEPIDEHRFFQKGHHPRLFVLRSRATRG